MNFTSQKEKDDYIAKVKQRIDLVKSKIEQVKAKQSQGEQGDYLGAAKAYMEYDPNSAMGWAGKADDRSIKEMSALLKGESNPDQVRFKLASRLNAISGQLVNLPVADPNYALLTAEQDKIRQELKSDNPSIQNVYNGVVTPSGGDQGGGDTATYASIITDIDNATKDNWKKVTEKVATDIESAKLGDTQKKLVADTLETKRKLLFPGKQKTDEQIISDVKESMSADEYKGFNVPSGLYNAGISNYNEGLYGTAIQNFIKASNPGEAVMADDVNMANKGHVDSKLLTVLKKIGYDPSNDNVAEIARKLGNTATLKMQKLHGSLDTYKFTPEQKKLFIKRYMGDAYPVTIGDNTTGGTKTTEKVGGITITRRKK